VSNQSGAENGGIDQRGSSRTLVQPKLNVALNSLGADRCYGGEEEARSAAYSL